MPKILALIEELGLEKWRSEDLESEVGAENTVLLTATDSAGNVNGFIHGRIVPSNSSQGGNDIQIFNIAVQVESRHQGVGSALLTELFERAASKGPREVWLEVRRANSSAIRFYTGHGFVARGIRRHFYRCPVEDAILMSRSLYHP